MYTYPVEFFNYTNGTFGVLSDNTTPLNLTYIVTCHDPTNQVVEGTTNYTWIVFDKSHGILPGRDYRCSVQTVEVVLNASVHVVSRTSVDSQMILQTTIEEKGRAGLDILGRRKAKKRLWEMIPAGAKLRY